MRSRTDNIPRPTRRDALRYWFRQNWPGLLAWALVIFIGAGAVAFIAWALRMTA